ncbi:reverse transcriptase [Trichonephila clavipes]|nr:reverse transcriptase [Trichonephila clavipes]
MASVSSLPPTYLGPQERGEDLSLTSEARALILNLWQFLGGSDNGDRCYTINTTHAVGPKSCWNPRPKNQQEVLLALRRPKGIISTYTDKCTTVTKETKSLGKPWKTLASVGPIPRHLERAEAVARFRLTTGHHLLGVYLHWLGLAAVEACPLCGYARMGGDDLLQCTGLNEYPADDIVSRYWEARRRIVKKLGTSVG